MSEATRAPRQGAQDKTAAAANAEYFAGSRHGEHASTIDTYRLIREALDRELTGIASLIDIGNGGVFEYDTSRLGSIVAVDLFLDQFPPDSFPDNVSVRRGDALSLQEADERYEAALHAMLYHHLVGRTVAVTITNIRKAISEAHRVLRPGGHLIVAEPCVPGWFYALERVLFQPLRLLAKTPLLRGHPATIQITPSRLESLVSERFEIERSYPVPRGRRTTLFGFVLPAILIPSRMRMVVARKAEQG